MSFEELQTVTWQTWAWTGGLVAAALIIGLIAHFVIYVVGSRLAKRAGNKLAIRLMAYSEGPSRLIMPMVAIQLVLPRMEQLTEGTEAGAAVGLLHHVLTLVLIAGIGWLVVSTMRVVDDIVNTRYKVDVRDNLEARKVHTQTRVLRQSMTVLVIIISASAMLMTFPQVRQLGASLLASAGLAGIVVGFASRPVLQNLIAGVQLAITQPIRVDDVLIVDGEWCRVEEITSTYVVMRIWDQRRLIVPLNFFIENTFQNWTRTSADILGTVFLWVDYTVPVEEIRGELHRLLQETEYWDKRAWALQVTDANDRAVEIRALMSAADAGSAFELRCFIREKLIEFIQKNHPGALPRMRAELDAEFLKSKGITAESDC